MTTAFVAGATGYTGREVVTALRQRDIRTIAHVRPDSKSLDRWRERFESEGATVDTTPWDESEMTETLRRIDPGVVFALLGTTRARGKQAERETGARDTYESVDYGLTALLLRAVLSAGLEPRFVYLSSAGVKESTRSPYFHARARVERELRQSGLPFTIARPSFITGPDRDEGRVGERVGAAVADAALGFAGLLGATQLRDRYRSTTNVALAGGLVHHALAEASRDAILESEALIAP